MASRRRASIMVNLEPTIYEILQRLLVQEESSASGYVRKLIIADLRSRDLLPDKILAELYAT